MPTCVTPAALSQSRSASSSRLTVRNVRTSLRARGPAAPISRHATTVSWCTSSPQHRSMIACILASLPQKATVTPQVSSRHCHTCSPFPGATKNSTFMQRGPDCLSGSNATQNASASTRSPIGNSDKPARAATIFNHNGARPAQPGCLGGDRGHLKLGIVGGLGLGGRDVPDRLEEAAVVEPVDPFEGGELDRFEAAPGAAPMDQLGFVEAVDGFGEGVIVAITDAANRRLDARRGKPLGILDRDVLHTAIAVMDEAAAPDGPARVQGLLQRVEHEASVSRAGDAPADDAPREDVDDEGDIDETGPRRDVGKVGHPQGVRTRRFELPIDAIERTRGGRIADMVRTLLPRTTPCRPIVRIRRATVQRATAVPSRRSCRQTLRTPWTRKFSSYTRRISVLRVISRWARAGSLPGSAHRAA